MEDLPKLNLYKNAFFLHSFLDEYIGNEKGNYAYETVKDFIKYAPDDLVDELTNATRYVEGITNIMSDIIYAGIDINEGINRAGKKIKKYNYVRGKCKNGEKIHFDLKTHIKSGNRIFLKMPPDYFYHLGINFSHETIASEYLKMPSKYFIDIDVEKKINDEIYSIVDNVIMKSKISPIFIPIGHPKHLLGLLITEKYVIVTNSGDGLQYHHTYDSLHPNSKIDDAKYRSYPQCVLYFNKPPDYIFKKILREFIQISQVYANTNINTVYSIIYKLYYCHQRFMI